MRLDGLRYHADVRTGTDVVVIGAGIIGCAIAREVARRGAQVQVLETSGIGAGATQASAGVLAPYIEAPSRGPLLELTTRSLAMYDGFVADLAESGCAVEYARCGTLEVAGDGAAAARLRQEQALFPDALHWLDEAVAREFEPALPPGIEGALRAPDHGYVRVEELIGALVASMQAHGATLQLGERAQSVRPGAGTLDVQTSGGAVVSARHVVMATGSWTGQVQVAGTDPPPVHPVRGQLLRLRWPGDPLRAILWGEGCYVVPWRDGTLLVGATMEKVGFDQRPTAAGVRDLLSAVCELLPAAWGATFLEARAGLRPASPDGLPFVGPSREVEGLVYAAGHFRNGILLAPLTAALVADYIEHGRMDPALEVMRPGRRSG